MDNLIAAILGASIAFIFVRLADFLTKIFEREERNYKALITYQHILTDYQFINYKNIKIIDNYCAPQDPTKLDVNFNTFHEYPVEKKTLQNLINIDLVNEIFILNEVLFAMNHNLETLSRVNEIMNNGMLDGNIDHGLYERTRDGIKNNLETRKKDILDFYQDIRSLLFTLNYLIKKKPLFYKIISKISNSRLSKTFKYNRDMEMKKPYKVLAEYKDNK